MVKFSRYILVIIAVIGFAIVLPKFYWMAFEKPIRAPFVQYSCVDNDFMIIRSNDGVKRTNSKGNILTREEYETKNEVVSNEDIFCYYLIPSPD